MDGTLILWENIDKFNEQPQQYVIGIDRYDVNAPCYCLAKVESNKTEILLCKRAKDTESFDEEVKNLSKYFNAKIIEEKK